MSACTQPGCAGVIEDGYCNVCGMAGAAATTATATAPSPGGGAPGTTASTRTGTGSTRTGSGKVPLTRSQRSSRSSRSTRSGSIRSGRTATRGLGSRPLARPALAAQDPLAAIVPGVVPERKRFCSGCDVALKRDSGFCPKCGQEYSFIPSLQPGDMVADKYEIKGTIAFGGLGWIYLGLDTVLTRWVTMKGLLNSKDPRMLEVAIKEREDLAAVKHPNIVGIYDFITHNGEGFIVMEYVNGKTLMSLRKERGEPLPVGEAISYIAEILPAFQYLDDMGFIYCDFKPENVMVEEETVKLIDMGAVRHVGETGGRRLRLQGLHRPRPGRTPRRSPTFIPWPAPSPSWWRASTSRASTSTPSPRRTRSRSSPSTSRSTASWSRRPGPSPRSASSRPPRWPSSSSACSAPWWGRPRISARPRARSSRPTATAPPTRGRGPAPTACPSSGSTPRTPPPT